MHIALLGSEDDPQILHLQKRLMSLEHQVLVVNTRYFGTQWQLSYDPDFNDGLLHFLSCSPYGKIRIPLSTIRSVYWHQYFPPETRWSVQQSWIDQEISSTLLCWFLFSETKWVNGIDAIRAHQCKPAQLSQASKLGAKVPYTFVGNAPDIAYQFCHNMQNTVQKPVKGGKTAFALPITPSLQSDIKALLEERPVTLQNFISGTNVRSYVLGDDVISVQIDTVEVDFRTDQHARPILTLLPKPIQQLAKKLCSGLDMYWCAIDWRRTTKGEYYFLEANPCPFFLFVENEINVDITGRLVKLLTT